ncbi:hypothetical protein GJU40_15125 [Bacillus lacus]|uniref:Hydrolase n=1 Tax=Metabacillus lacus TaxID=1983721 RepID=A0A7X2M0Z1_9BACI|nr:hypothetical protein [Metabacillus lacus]MRX73474.1 hypothetical protein [Metabacillus lacus]
MEIAERFFKIEGEWSVIHYPYRPNGFGVFILGDKQQFVDGKSSFWQQHIGRKQLLDALLLEGYTVFYSNLYGKHWNSLRSIDLARKTIHIVLKKEILNKKIHLLAEGMGALTSLEIMNSPSAQIRSAAMLNPCLDLPAQILLEKQNRFYFKKLLMELAAAHGIDQKEVLKADFRKLEDYESDVPVRIWQKTNNSPYPYQQHCRRYEEIRKKQGSSIDLVFHMADNSYRLHQAIPKFFKEHEKNL